MVLGLDEAGRGPWAGPVTAAAAWINPCAITELPPGLNDSKKLSRAKREEVFAALAAMPEQKFRYAVVSISAEQIDALGILPATFRAMDKAACQVMDRFSPDDRTHLLVDGSLAPPFDGMRKRQHHPLGIQAVIKGDQRSLSIAAASIMAKETRDLEMTRLDHMHPGYDWASNMGYGTASHQHGLATQGPTQHHRFTYKPVAEVAAKFGTTR
ncbi:MAG: ribonuclease HII [Alphaproteobacteria bacterium]|nr:ribonuclease HII [Alphaproteobacteria bacterium]